MIIHHYVKSEDLLFVVNHQRFYVWLFRRYILSSIDFAHFSECSRVTFLLEFIRDQRFAASLTYSGRVLFSALGNSL